MSWFSLALFSAFFLASADAVTKRYLSHYRPGEIVLVRFGVTGLLLLPLLFTQPWPELTVAFWMRMAALLPLEILAMWLYMKAISRSPLSLTLPFLAFTPVFTTVTGYILLGETITLTGFAGILLVVGGSWLLNLDTTLNKGTMGLFAPFRAILLEDGSRLMVYVAALYSLTSVLGKAMLQSVSPEFFAPFYFVLLGIVASLIYVAKLGNPGRLFARRPWVHLLVGLLMSGMVLTHFYSIEHAKVAYMISVKRSSLLFGMVYGAWLFAEKGLFSKLMAGMLMVVGVFLIVV